MGTLMTNSDRQSGAVLGCNQKREKLIIDTDPGIGKFHFISPLNSICSYSGFLFLILYLVAENVYLSMSIFYGGPGFAFF